MFNTEKEVPFHQVLAALLDDSKLFPPQYLHQFSDLDDTETDSLRAIWSQIQPERRITLISDLSEIAETDTMVLFDQVARLALSDSEAQAREAAVKMLWESDDNDLPKIFIDMMYNDPSTIVRAAAASALGKFIYLGELEELPADILHAVEEELLQTIQGQDDDLVRRHALEAMGYSGRPEVPDLIRAAYKSPQQEWLTSALFAMGRSADDSWGPEVIRQLRSRRNEVRFEAVRAAGELSLAEARPLLLELVGDEDLQDEDLRRESIWALSKIGGEDVRDTFEQLLEETEDEDEAEFLEDALDNLSFTEDMGLFDMLDVETDDDDETADVDEDDDDFLADELAAEFPSDEDETFDEDDDPENGTGAKGA